jgi:hypothetical protein
MMRRVRARQRGIVGLAALITNLAQISVAVFLLQFAAALCDLVHTRFFPGI